LTVISLLNGGYDRNAKFVMSKKTLFQDFIPLQDKAKNDIVSKEGNQYFIQGYPVLLDDSVAIHEAYLGDFKKYVANMAQAINVKSGEDLRTNSYLYLGSCMFDGKPAIGEAFVKIIKEGTV
jgi:HK97 family phage major capsid protein